MRTGIKGLLISAAASTAILAAAPLASASTVVVGSPLTGTVNNEICSAPCTIANTAFASPSATAKVPADGTITSWSFKANTGAMTGNYALRVVRPVSGGFTGGGRLLSPTVSTSSADMVFTQSNTSLAVKAGDFIGLDTLAGPGSPDVSGDPNMGDVISYFAAPDLADGGAAMSGFSLPQHQVLVQATVTIPDAQPATTCTVPKVKGKKVAKAKKAITAAGCKPKVKKKFSSKKKGKVLSQSVAAGTSKPSGTVVTIKVSKGPKH
jgi:hypothetical protein